MTESTIDNVSDTALWVAQYRALESERPDFLFRDPLAAKLAGERGKAIAKKMGATRYMSWSVVIRTCIIDAYLQELIANGINTVLNLGAGLDTRPYRLSLPASLRWVEVDFPHVIEYKENLLKSEVPTCNLERVKLDLSVQQLRRDFFSTFSEKSIVVLTEGVVLYLNLEQVALLAKDLRHQKNFNFWIVDYFTPRVVRYMRGRKLQKQMKNAPFLFHPKDWYSFFKEQGWEPRETRYLADVSEKLGREIPLPFWAKLLGPIIPRNKWDQFRKFSGYVLLQPR